MDNVQEMEIEPEELDSLMETDSLTLIDIREDHERELVSLDDDLWIRMEEIPDQIDHLEDADRPIVIYCHHGIRSLRIAKLMRENGFEEVFSLAGGIDRWAKTIDPDLPTY
jgi:rhodanese-related sulfurtransferase